MLKLDVFQALALTVIIAGATFDIATTEFLLAMGSVQADGNLVSFAEANPLFHTLGHNAFLGIYVSVTCAMALLVVYAPKIFKRGSSFYAVALTVLAFYGVVHFLLGWQNYQIVQTYVFP